MRKHPKAPSVAPPAAGTPSPGATGVPQRGQRHTSGPAAAPSAGVSNPGIMKMQQALINLSKDVASQIHIQDLGDNENQRGQGEAASRNSFGNFITKNYLRDSDIPGVEFDPNPGQTDVAKKKPSTPTRLGVIVDTMNRIGNPKTGEFAVDGKWGPRTDAAVRNAYAFAYAVLKLANDFKLPVRSYTDGNLATLKELITQPDGAELAILDKIKNAPRITVHIDAIMRMYNEIKEGILQKPAYQQYIEGDKPFATYTKGGTQTSGAQLAPEQVELINKAFGNTLQAYDKPISINDLLTADAFKAWAQKNVPQVPLDVAFTTVKKQMQTAMRNNQALSDRG